MRRTRRKVAAPLLAWPLFVSSLLGQQIDWNNYAQSLNQLPPSTFAKQQIGVRGMQLATVAKLDPRLRSLVDQSREGVSVRTRSLQLGANSTDLLVPVVANASDPGHAAALAKEIKTLGGNVTATYDTTVWAMLAASSIDRLAASPDVAYLSVQDRLQPAQEAVKEPDDMSLRATGVIALQKSGVRGRGVKIGIIDFGFGAYSRMQRAGKVPAPAQVRSFPESFPVENDSLHGTACVEIIHAMAPEAQIFMASSDPHEGNVIRAAQWLISQGVDIISYSAGNLSKPNDGTSDMDRFVDTTTTENGVVWVISTGNSGTVHWKGKNDQADAKGFIKTGQDGQIGIEMVPTKDVLDITVRWSDWGPDPRHPSSSQDIDAYLLHLKADGSGLEMVAKSDDPQNGTGSPLEAIHYEKKGIVGQHFLLVLRNTKVDRTVDIHVFVDHNERAAMNPESPAGSVLSPASASYAIGVGAWIPSIEAPANYSSEGPTDDNRLKPEVAAPAGIYSATYGEPFHGTSAACPHVAGFAALLKQAHPELRGVALRSAVIHAVIPNGTPVPNLISGYGWIDGGHILGNQASAPGPPAVPPANGPSQPVSAYVSLPPAWGGRIPVELLEHFQEPAGQAPEFLIRVMTGRDIYRIGDGLKVGFKASADCAYLLFHRSSAGEYTLLSPRDSTVGLLAAGAAQLLPSERETFEVTPPAGTEELILICARQPVNLEQAAANPKLSAELVVSRHQYQISP